MDQNVVDSASTTGHEVQLTGLTPYASYFYSIGDSSGPLAGDGTYYFRTSPNPGIAKPTRIWVIGDSGTANSNAWAVRDRYKEYTGPNETHLWLMLGDNAYNSGTDNEYQNAVFNTYPEILRQTPLWSTLGNHDGYSADSSSQSGPYYDIFSLPKNAEVGGAASGTEAYCRKQPTNTYVIAYDAAGNESAFSNLVNATTAAGGCIVTADSFLILGDNKIEWDLTNESPETINISMKPKETKRVRLD